MPNGDENEPGVGRLRNWWLSSRAIGQVIDGRNKANLNFLQNKMIQTEDWPEDKPLTEKDIRTILKIKIEELDIEAAKKDVEVFLKGPSNLEIWSKDFFIAAAQRLKVDS